MKKIYLFLFIFLSAFTAISQEIKHHRCYSDENHENENARRDVDVYNYTFQNNKNRQARIQAPGPNNGVLTIPVIFHILYNTATENIPDSKILEQIKILNEDYRKKNTGINTINPFHIGLATDAQIEFVLATKDPNCVTMPVAGIERKKINKSYVDHQINEAKFASLGGLDAWPSNQYLNVWVVPRIDLGTNTNTGIAGVGQFPGGDPKTDGVIITYVNVGYGSVPNYNLGRTATHEVGHWLGLRHLWGMNVDGCNANDDDLVADTPMQTGPSTGCPANQSTCQNWDMTENFMDYSYDQCMKFFSKGQVDRMWATLANERKSFYDIATGKRSIKITSVDIGLVGDNITLKYEITPSCGANPIITLTNGTGTAVLNGNNLTLTKEGTVTIKIDVAASDGFSSATTSQVITINPYVIGEPCPANFNLEDGTKSKWVCKSGGFKDGAWSFPWLDCRNPRGNNAPLIPTGAFYVEDLHVITTGPGTDPNSNGNIPVVCPTGGRYSVRIGDAKGFSAEDRVGGINSNPSIFGWRHATAIAYPLLVTKENAKFIYMYSAFVQEDNQGGSSHQGTNAAGFQVLIYDKTGKEVACGKYNFDAHTHVGMIKGRDDGNGPWWYTPWTDVSIDLSAYIGQTINVEFRVQDCAYGAHSAYAYIDVKCEKPEFNLSKPICGTVGDVEMCAPKGYKTYKWGPNTKISTSLDAQCVTIKNPVVGDKFTVAVTTYTGCPIVLTQEIKGLTVTANTDASVCAKNNPNYTLFAISSVDDSSLVYKWTSIPAGLSKTGNPLVIPTPNTTTKYIVEASNADGCSAKDTFNLTIQNCGITAILDNAQEICKGNCAEITASASGGTLPYTYKWLTTVPTPGNAKQTVCPTQTTSYKVEVSDASGQKDTAEVIITVNTLPTVKVDDKSICIGDKTTLQATGAITYTWSPNTNLNTISGDKVDANPTATTKYYVAGTDSKGCKNIDSAIVTVNLLPKIDAGTKFTICNGSTGQLTATGGISYNWLGANLSNNAISNPISSATSKTLYTVTGSDANGCKNSDTITIDVQDKIVLSVSASKTDICKGETVQVIVAGADKYEWLPTTGVDNSTSSSPNITLNQTTKYTVKGNQGTCPEATAEITITVTDPQKPQVSDLNYCKNQSASQLTAIGSNLKWYTALTGSSALTSAPTPITSNVGTTSYFVTQTINNCESEKAELKVSVGEAPKPIANNVTYCKNDIATALTATGTNLKWYTANGGVALNATPIPLTNNAGTVSYFVSQTIDGCESEKTELKVITNETVSPTVSDVSFCKNETPTTWQVTGTSIRWYATEIGGSALGSAPIITTTVAGTTTYYVSQTTNNCESPRVAIKSTVLETPIPVTQDFGYCKGNIATSLTATGTNLKWYSTQIGGNALNTTPIPNTAVVGNTSYFVSQTINNCESERAEVKVKIGESPKPTVTDVTFCKGTNANALTAIPFSQSRVGYTNETGILKWYNTQNGGTELSSAPIPSTKTVGQFSYYVSQVLGGCESERVELKVTINESIAPVINPTMLYCRNVVSTALDNSYYWFKTEFDNNELLNFTPSTNVLGVQTYWAENRSNGCVSNRVKQEIHVIENPSIDVVMPSVICQGDQLTIKLTLTGLAPFGITYIYNNQSMYVESTKGTLEINYFPNESGQILFSSIKDKQCANAYSNLINEFIVNAIPVVKVLSPDTVCNKTQFDILTTITAPSTSLKWWSNASNKVTGTSAGELQGSNQYLLNQEFQNLAESVQVINYNFQAKKDNCIGPLTSKILKLLPIYLPNLPKQLGPICKGDSIKINAKTPNQIIKFTWEANASLLSNKSLLSFKSNGEELINLTTIDVCKNSNKYPVLISYRAKELISMLQLDSCSNYFTPINVLANPKSDFLDWQFLNDAGNTKNTTGTNEFTIKVPTVGIFPLAIQLYNLGCKVTDTLVSVKAKDCSIVTTNTFTPNADDDNDIWIIKGIENEPTASLTIFNRWGQIVKYTPSNINPSNAWDGNNSKGETMEEGTYYYIIEVRNGLNIKKGYITLIKK